MPVVQIQMLEGRTLEQKRAMAKKVTEALVETINCNPQAVMILIKETVKEHIANGGVLKCDE